MRFKKHVNKPLLFVSFGLMFTILYIINPACALAYVIGLVMMYYIRSAFVGVRQ